MSHLDHSRTPDELPALVERLEPQIGRIIGRFHVSPADAEDLLQETLLQYVIHCRAILSPEAWLLGTLRKQCLMHWRRHHRSFMEAIDAGLLAELAGTGPAPQEREDLSRDVSRVVGRLPKRCRSVLQLRYSLGCDDPEVAARLGYSPTGIRKITHRCLSALSHQMVASGFTASIP